jgi:hypothetical protein
MSDRPVKVTIELAYGDTPHTLVYVAELEAEVARLDWMLRLAWEEEFVLSAMPGESNYSTWLTDLKARAEEEIRNE